MGSVSHELNLQPLLMTAPAPFAELYERHYAMVYRAALRITGNPADAEDVLQSVLLRVLSESSQEDIPLLVDHFIEKFNRNNEKQIHGVHPRTMGALLRYHWPGNVRQLENCVERAAVMADGPMLTLEDTSHILRSASTPKDAAAGCDETSGPLNLKEAEKIVMLRALRSIGGDKTRAADLLGISLRTL